LRYFSTKNKRDAVSFRTAIMKGLPDDNGLFVPESIPKLDPVWIDTLQKHSFTDIGFEMARGYIGDEIPESDLHTIIEKAIDFPAPVVMLDGDMGILELFHGPSLAFKDFGARFMAGTMSYFLQEETKETTILVATSGDTGGAVAYGFLGVPGIKVVILYPSGKVSDLQEKQLTTLGSNISALEVHGNFDDCQAMVKQAFLDTDLQARVSLSSANSINIARLIPQSFYYAEAYKQVMHIGKPVVFAVPSGNFGNLTAGLYAREMGVPIHHFIAATNANAVFPDYINTGHYAPQPSVSTLSNAMDVGNPSNFYRILDLYGSTWNTIKSVISSYSIDNDDTLATMQRVYQSTGYSLDPHTAVAYLAAQTWQRNYPITTKICLETAHPSKFLNVMELANIHQTPIPERLAILSQRVKQAVMIQPDYAELKEYLLKRQ
jgi:threonine synthase